jgi:hypothetical protein
MLKARLSKELVLKVHNEIGVLAQIAKVLAERGVNILAASAWVQGSDGMVHVVVDDTLRAGEALRGKNFAPREADVVLVEAPHKPGMLKHLTEQLAQEGIDLHHLYASAASDAGNSLIAFASANNDRALVVLNS